MSEKKLSGKALVIQLTRDHLRIAKTTLGSAMPQVLDADVYDLPEDAVDDGAIRQLDAVQAVLRHALENPELRRIKRVIFTLCTTQVISEQASMPKMNPNKLDKILETNMDVYFPVDTQNYHLTWEILDPGTKDTDMSLQLWAVPSGMVEDYYLLANGCGLSVVAIDYCAHSLASAVDASFGQTKVKAAAGKKGFSLNMPLGKKKEEDEEFVPSAPATETSDETELILQAEPEHLLMLFVQNGQVKLQRMFLCGSRVESELGEVAMALDYYDTMEFGRYSTIKCSLCGSLADDERFVDTVQAVLDIPVRVLPSLNKPEWTLCLGASRTTLDFGIPSLNKPGGVSQINNAWQYGLILVGGAVLALSVVATLGSKTIWNTTISGLQNTQQSLQIQAAQNANYAQNYYDYQSKYQSYSSDWDTIFSSLRTYNDNLVLMLDELEQVLPKNSSVVGIGIENQGLTLQIASPTKEEAAYVIKSLRGLQYADLLGISDLVKGGTQAYEAAPTVGSGEYEQLLAILAQASQTSGSQNTAGLVSDAIKSGLITEEMLGQLLSSGTVDADMAAQLIKSGAIDQKTIETLFASGAIDKDTVQDLIDSGAVDKDLISSVLGSGTLDQKEIMALIFDLTPEQFNALEDAYGSVPKNKYTMSELLKDATFKQRKAAMSTMLNKDPFAMYRFFNLFKVDMNRKVSEAVLHEDVYAEIWKNSDMLFALMSGDLSDAQDAVPVLVDALCQSDETLTSAEKLITEDERLEKRYAYYLAVEMGRLEESDDPIIDSDQIIEDIITGNTPDVDNPEDLEDALDTLLPGISDLLKPSGSNSNNNNNNSSSGSSSELPDWLQDMLNGGSGSTNTGSTGSTSGLPDWITGMLGGNTGSGAAAAQPVDNRYHFNIVLGYKQALIEAERERKGLNYADKLPELEVAE